jgi:SAM-dependent methyltransferase
MAASELSMPKAFSSSLMSVAIQIFSFMSFLLIRNFWFESFPLLGCSLIAWIFAKIFSLTLPWQILNTIMPFAIVWGLTHSLPGWVFLIIALSLFALFLPALFAQVPFFPSSTKVVEALVQELPLEKSFRFIDLGCGFGEPIFSLARLRPEGTFIGIDVSPFSVLVAWVRSLFYANVKIRFSNLWKHHLGKYDIVYAFLAPPPMIDLASKLVREAREGRLVISNSFSIPGWSGEQKQTGDSRQHSLFIYKA